MWRAVCSHRGVSCGGEGDGVRAGGEPHSADLSHDYIQYSLSPGIPDLNYAPHPHPRGV
jgi:hypothetical protein